MEISNLNNLDPLYLENLISDIVRKCYLEIGKGDNLFTEPGKDKTCKCCNGCSAFKQQMEEGIQILINQMNENQKEIVENLTKVTTYTASMQLNTKKDVMGRQLCIVECLRYMEQQQQSYFNDSNEKLTQLIMYSDTLFHTLSILKDDFEKFTTMIGITVRKQDCKYTEDDIYQNVEGVTSKTFKPEFTRNAASKQMHKNSFGYTNESDNLSSRGFMSRVEFIESVKKKNGVCLIYIDSLKDQCEQILAICNSQLLSDEGTKMPNFEKGHEQSDFELKNRESLDFEGDNYFGFKNKDNENLGFEETNCKNFNLGDNDCKNLVFEEAKYEISDFGGKNYEDLDFGGKNYEDLDFGGKNYEDLGFGEKNYVQSDVEEKNCGDMDFIEKTNGNIDSNLYSEAAENIEIYTDLQEEMPEEAMHNLEIPLTSNMEELSNSHSHNLESNNAVTLKKRICKNSRKFFQRMLGKKKKVTTEL